jgi:transglutaminase-like putative cysteine protease
MAFARVDRIKILLTILLLLCPMAVGAYRASRADYEVERIAPSAAYRVRLRVFYETASDTIRVRAYLPQNETNLSLGMRWTDSNLSGADEYRRGGNRILERWGETEGRGKVEIAFTVISRNVAYYIDSSFQVPGPPSELMLPFLESKEVVQVDDPAIATLAVELAPAGSSAAASLRRIYDYCRSLPGPETSPDTARQADDALGTLESQAGSELGKVRLFAALARHQGLPTRFVQGIVLEPGLEIDPATWVEVRLGPTWVPFCPARDLFARTAGVLVPFARGDVPIVEAGPSSDLEVRYAVEKTFAMRGRLVERGTGKASSSWLGVWAALEESGIPVDIQRIALMIPFGAFMTILVRNILGLRTFGFFLPLLIAITATRTGLGWTLSAFLFVIGLVYLIRLLARPLRLLHFPIQGIMLTMTVLAVTGLAAWGALTGNLDLAQITFLPVVVLTIATERFSTIFEEEGPLEVLKVILMSIVAIVLCFLVMNSWELQTFVLTFPESLLVVVFLEVVIGSWTGVRVLEYFRFRRLLPVTEGVARA